MSPFRLCQQEQKERLERAWRIPESDVRWDRKLAGGTFGEVWAGRWGHLPVAIKVLRQRVVLDADDVDDSVKAAAADFRRECDSLQTIKHPHLLSFYGAGVTLDHQPFLVTELMPHGSLRHVLTQSSVGEISLAWVTRVRFAAEIAEGMRHLHTLEVALIHRDLKSENVLVTSTTSAARNGSTGEMLIVKVGDFGNARCA
jgi:serine/threonine protein kinase